MVQECVPLWGSALAGGNCFGAEKSETSLLPDSHPLRGWQPRDLQSCLTPCDPMNHSSPGSPVHGILRTRTLEWVAILSSRGSSQPRDQTCISCISRSVLYHGATGEAPVTTSLTLCPFSHDPAWQLPLKLPFSLQLKPQVSFTWLILFCFPLILFFLTSSQVSSDGNSPFF